jgi:hypothetical protein
MQKKSADNSNFINKKQSFEEFIKLQESEMTDEKKQSALLTYKTKFAELDKKHGFDSTKKYNNEEYKFSQDGKSISGEEARRAVAGGDKVQVTKPDGTTKTIGSGKDWSSNNC